MEMPEITGEDNHQQEEVPSFACEICIEPIYSGKRFKNSEKKWCHDSYCSDCIAKYIQAKIEEYNTADIKCPGLGCNEFLDPLACRSILPKRVLDRWCDALCESTVLGMGCQRSHCPYSDCSTVFLAKCIAITKTSCSKCNRMFCFKCKVPWDPVHDCLKHVGLENSDDALALSLAVAKKWRRCPGCHIIVEKHSGCSYMKCRCGTRFSYDSGRLYSNPWHYCKCNCCRRRFAVFLMCLLIFVVGVPFGVPCLFSWLMPLKELFQYNP